MKGDLTTRCVTLGKEIVETKATVRELAEKVGLSKSTVHKDVTERLPEINPILAEQVRAVLEENKAERHIHGGIATREKYKGTFKWIY